MMKIFDLGIVNASDRFDLCSLTASHSFISLTSLSVLQAVR
jgi:hypothetical protein